MFTRDKIFTKPISKLQVQAYREGNLQYFLLSRSFFESLRPSLALAWNGWRCPTDCASPPLLCWCTRKLICLYNPSGGLYMGFALPLVASYSRNRTTYTDFGLQERIMAEPYGKDHEMFQYSLFLVFCNRCITCLIALSILLVREREKGWLWLKGKDLPHCCKASVLGCR